MKKLSIEQMQYLQELGVDTSKASMFYVLKDEYCLSNIKFNHAIPTFTLQDIIELLPKEIEYNSKLNYLTIKYNNDEFAFMYSNEYDSIKYICEYDIIQTAYQMLCWCAETGHLKNN